MSQPRRISVNTSRIRYADDSAFSRRNALISDSLLKEKLSRKPDFGLTATQRTGSYSTHLSHWPMGSEKYISEDPEMNNAFEYSDAENQVSEISSQLGRTHLTENSSRINGSLSTPLVGLREGPLQTAQNGNSAGLDTYMQTVERELLNVCQNVYSDEMMKAADCAEAKGLFLSACRVWYRAVKSDNRITARMAAVVILRTVGELFTDAFSIFSQFKAINPEKPSDEIHTRLSLGDASSMRAHDQENKRMHSVTSGFVDVLYTTTVANHDFGMLDIKLVLRFSNGKESVTQLTLDFDSDQEQFLTSSANTAEYAQELIQVFNLLSVCYTIPNEDLTK